MAGIPTIESYPLPTAGELPDNAARWIIQPARAVLLVHDMQRYFLRPLPDELREQLIGNISLLRDQCRARRIPIAYTAQPGGMNDEQRGLLKDFWGPGMQVDPADRQIVEQLAPGPDDWLFAKWRYSAFFRSDLLARMREYRRDQIIVCGIYAHVGVLMTAVEAFSNDIETFLVADAIADFSKEHHRMTVDYASSRCAVVTTVGETLP